MTTATPNGVLLLGQGQGGVVFGAFANCPLIHGVSGKGRTLNSTIFVLEHPTGEQRKWELRNIYYTIRLNERFLWFGTGLGVSAIGFLHTGSAPEFGRTEAGGVSSP
jgi:hypothetical protein